MSALLRSEWLKIRTTKLPWLLLGIGIVYSCVQAVTLTLIAAGMLPGIPGGDLLMDPRYVTALLGQAGTAATFVLLLGVIAMTGEFRHMTITSTFLATPQRARVLVAKGLTYAAVGAAVAVVAVVFVLLTSAVALAPFEHAPITIGAIGSVLVGAMIGMALYAVLGVAVGSLITNQVAAIVTTLLWVLLVEALVGLAFPAVAGWLPSGALESAMSVGLRADLSGSMTAADGPPAWAGILVLLGYAAVLGLLASRTTLRRDIT